MVGYARRRVRTGNRQGHAVRVLNADANEVAFDGGGWACETNSGAIIIVTARDGNARLWRSTDDGVTWSQRATMTITAGATGVRGLWVDSRGYIYAGGTTETTYETYTKFAEVWRSTDDGVTWSKVCTGESSAFWHFTEDSTGRVYVNEYSLVPSSGTEYPAVNVWRSDTSGANFAKWHTATKETVAGARDGVRHIHTVHCDGSDRIFVAYGDTGWTGDARKVVRLDSSGVIDLDYGAFAGNGITAMIHNDDGIILCGNDFNPSGIMAIPPTVALNCRNLHLPNQLTTVFDAYVFDLHRGHDDSVIFGHTTLVGRTPLILFSTDEGANWSALDYGGVSPGSAGMTINRGAPNQRMYLSGNPIVWVEQPSASVLAGRGIA